MVADGGQQPVQRSGGVRRAAAQRQRRPRADLLQHPAEPRHQRDSGAVDRRRRGRWARRGQFSAHGHGARRRWHQQQSVLLRCSRLLHRGCWRRRRRAWRGLPDRRRRLRRLGQRSGGRREHLRGRQGRPESWRSVMIRSRATFVVTAIVALAAPLAARAQTTVSEDFSGTSTNNSWWYFNGACLTAADQTAKGSEPTGNKGGQLPGCVAIGQGGNGPLYYNEPLVGGVNGVGTN